MILVRGDADDVELAAVLIAVTLAAQRATAAPDPRPQRRPLRERAYRAPAEWTAAPRRWNS